MSATETLVSSMPNGRPTVPPLKLTDDGTAIAIFGILFVVISLITFVICYCCSRMRKEVALLDNNLQSDDSPQPYVPITAEQQRITTELTENNLCRIGWSTPSEGTSSQIGQSSNGSTNPRSGIYTISNTFLSFALTANTQGSKIENDFEDPPPPYPGF